MSFRIHVDQEDLKRARQAGFIQFVSRRQLEEKSELYTDIIDLLESIAQPTPEQSRQLASMNSKINHWNRTNITGTTRSTVKKTSDLEKRVTVGGVSSRYFRVKPGVRHDLNDVAYWEVCPSGDVTLVGQKGGRRSSTMFLYELLEDPELEECTIELVPLGP
jgi:hypothetical protein